MAATTTNKVSSLSQAHFDEILVLVEHDSVLDTVPVTIVDVLILVLMEIAAQNLLSLSQFLVVLILVLMEIAAPVL